MKTITKQDIINKIEKMKQQLLLEESKLDIINFELYTKVKKVISFASYQKKNKKELSEILKNYENCFDIVLI